MFSIQCSFHVAPFCWYFIYYIANRTPRAISTLKTIFQIHKQKKRPKTTHWWQSKWKKWIGKKSAEHRYISTFQHPILLLKFVSSCLYLCVCVLFLGNWCQIFQCFMRYAPNLCTIALHTQIYTQETKIEIQTDRTSCPNMYTIRKKTWLVVFLQFFLEIW